jgi:cell division protein FtsX
VRRAGGTALLATLLVVVTALPAFADADEVPYRQLARPDLEVFLEVGATDAQVQAVVDRVRDLDGVRRYAVLSRRNAYQELGRTFGPDSGIVRATSAGDLPPSVRVQVAPRRASDVRRRLARMRGVETVATARMLEENLRLLEDLNDICGRGDESLEVFMAVDEHLGAVRAALDGDPGVVRYRFVDHATAYAEFQRRFREDQDLVQSIDPADLPESFRVVLRDAALSEPMDATLSTMGGVEFVHRATEACSALRATGLVP